MLWRRHVIPVMSGCQLQSRLSCELWHRTSPTKILFSSGLLSAEAEIHWKNLKLLRACSLLLMMHSPPTEVCGHYAEPLGGGKR